MGIGLLAAGGTSVNRIMLANYQIESADIGLYALSFRLLSVVPLGLQNLIGNIHSREIYKSLAGGKSTLHSVIRENLRLAFLCFVGMHAIFWVVYFFLDMFLGLAYSLSVADFPWYFILASAFSISLATSFITPIFVYIERTSTLLVVNIVGFLVLVTFNLFFINSLGVWASAISFLLMHLVKLICLGTMCYNAYRNNLWN